MEKEEKKEIPEVVQETTNASEEKPEETQEIQPTKENFSKFKSRMKNLYPDREFASDEDFDNAGDEYMVSRETADKALIDLFDEHPEIIKILQDLKDGAPSLRAAIVSHYSPDELIAQEGDKDFEAWSKNATGRAKRLEDKRKSDTDYETNIEASIKAIQDFAAENSLDETATNDFIGKIQGFLDDYNKGVISKEFLSLLKSGLTAKTDIETALEEGRIQGRNENIAAKKVNIDKGDGMPNISGGGEMPIENKTVTAQERGDNYIDGLLGKKKPMPIKQ